MKLIETEYYTEEPATEDIIEEVLSVIGTDSDVLDWDADTLEEFAELAEEDPDFEAPQGHEWIVLSDDVVKNYVQAAGVCPEDNVLLMEQNPNAPELEPGDLLVEARFYDESGAFQHYRLFTHDRESVKAIFLAYLHDEPFSVTGWYDVTDEFGPDDEEEDEEGEGGDDGYDDYNSDDEAIPPRHQLN